LFTTYSVGKQWPFGFVDLRGCVVTSRCINFGVNLAVATAVFLGLSVGAQAQTGLIFSEYLECMSNNKILEIYNGTGADLDLAAAGIRVSVFLMVR
jgi:uncharacterized protein